MSSCHSKLLQSHKIVVVLNDILECESDSEHLEYSDDDHVLQQEEIHSSSSCEEFEEITTPIKLSMTNFTRGKLIICIVTSMIFTFTLFVFFF